MARKPKRVTSVRPATWTGVLDALYAGSWNANLSRFRSPFAFRGLSRDDHVLSSSLIRLAAGADIRRLELALLRNFRKYAHGEVPGADSLWHWLTLGQHRGLPTRMIDWTYSPFVALHFATEDTAAYDQDAIVWCVNFVEANKRLPRRLRTILEKEGSDTFTVDMLRELGSLRDFDALSREPFVVFVEPPAMDRRILNQFALFSLMSDPSAVLHDWLRRNPELCRSVVIPASLKWEIRDKLDQANINERVLFPDLDGLSRWLERYYTPAQPGGARRHGSLRQTLRSPGTPGPRTSGLPAPRAPGPPGYRATGAAARRKATSSRR